MLPEALSEPIFLYYQLNGVRRFQLPGEGLVFLLPIRFQKGHVSIQITPANWQVLCISIFREPIKFLKDQI